MRNEKGIDSLPINLSAKRTPSKVKGEPGRERGRTRAFVDVGAVNPSAGVAYVASACEGAVGVEARRVGVAVVGFTCDRGAGPVSSAVSPTRVRAISHTGSTAIGLGGPRSGSIDYGRS